MKKFVFGVAAGLAVYQIIRSRGLKNRIKARASQFGKAVFDRTTEKLYERAVKNGVTEAEIAELIRVVDKVMK